MEDWSEYGSSIVFPGSGSERTFWDSGNEGAKKANDILTSSSSDYHHNGNMSARLESKFASVLELGNLQPAIFLWALMLKQMVQMAF